MDDDRWIRARAVYDLALQRDNMPWAEIGHRMVALIGLLERDSRFAGVDVFSPMLALGLKIPGARQAVHVIWDPENTAYQVFLDHCEGEFHGNFAFASSADIVDVISLYLHRFGIDF
ncbi:hypothetical protein [Aggregatilinea lenta]|uniref:hypothetical protein n=1 Tax=Aggregatilinea lenta TaxID=913108 RepID=UPI0013C2CD24|nr:hypothetical protein [Aggregatilinea lenta]